MTELSTWPDHAEGSQSMRWASETSPLTSGRPRRPNVLRMLTFHTR